MTKRQMVDKEQPNAIQFDLDEAHSAFEETIQESDFKMGSLEYDLRKVLEKFRLILVETLEKALKKFHGVKVSFIVTVQYNSKDRKEPNPFNMYLRATSQTLLRLDEIEEIIEEMYREINMRNENVQCGSSN